MRVGGGKGYAAEMVNSIGSKIEGSSFSRLLTRVEIGHIRNRLGRVLSLSKLNRGLRGYLGEP
jgi:hypothetical protein